MIRKIIEINQDKCNGCGACAAACHEGAIGMVNGKAKLLRDDYCDGLGDCLPSCPTGAITFTMREAAEYNAEAVAAKKKSSKIQEIKTPCGCMGAKVKTINHGDDADKSTDRNVASCLGQWPVQIKLVPVSAPYFDGANLLISADCAAYSYGNFHREFIKNRITVIGCPKLDGCDYSEKLTEIIKNNDIKSVTVVRMEVPCCGGIENAAKTAIKNSGKFIPWRVVTISTDGRILEE